MQSILSGLNRTADGGTTAQATAINNTYALALNRNLAVSDKDDTLDNDFRVSVGNTYDFAPDLEGGFQLSGAYASKWHNTQRYQAIFSTPDEQFENEDKSTYAVDISGTATFGLRYLDKHEVTVASLFLRNSDDELSISDFHNENRQLSSGLGFRGYRFEFEEAEMLVNQVKGEHLLGLNTKEM